MRARRLVLGVVIFATACGRLGFEGPTVDGEFPPGDGLAPDQLVKLSVDRPLLDSPIPGSGDCGQYMMHFAADATNASELMPFAFVDATDTIWFTVSCKDIDSGWSVGLARWTPGGEIERLDAQPGTSGADAFIHIDDFMTDGMKVTSTRQLRFAFGADGKLYGLGARFTGGTPTHTVVPVLADTPEMLSASSYEPSIVGAFEPAAAPWTMSTGLGRDIVRVGTTFYLYSVHWDGTSTTSTGSNLTSIGVASTTDMRSSTFLASPLVTGWADPMVTESGGVFHMVARDLSTNTYNYVRGTSPTDFDFDNATPLRLAGMGGAPGAWDELRYTAHGLSGEPRIATARVVAGVLYLFYLAGVPPNGGAASLPTARRGLGAFRIPLE